MIRYILSTLIFIIAFYILVYNHIRHLSINVENTWSDIDVQLKRRNDLIPNLVLIVKGQTQYERSTLIQITKLRQALNQALDTDQPNRKRITALNQQLNLDLQELTIFVENYPDLKANEHRTCHPRWTHQRFLRRSLKTIVNTQFSDCQRIN